MSSDQVQLRILGPVEVNVTGQWFAPGPPKQRALLAALALNAGRTVSVPSLIQTLWDKDPPASAVKNIQLYIWKLRASLGGLLQLRASGYCLPEQAVALDVDRFNSLVQLAHQARRDNDEKLAMQRLTEALEVWRGPALADVVAAGMAANLARPLTAERSRVIHDLAELAIEVGQAAELVPQLENWIAEEPLDERLRELHVQALLEDDRPAEALTAYLQAESAFSTDLGTRPGTALRALSDSARRAMGQTPAKTPVPHQIPPAIATFVGRRGQISALVQALSPRVRSVPVVAIVGPGGIGKSALAVRVAHRIAEGFPDGQLYVDLQGASPGLEPLSVLNALSTLLRSLGVAGQHVPDDAAEALRLYRDRTAGRSILVVVDNAVDADQVRQLVPGTGRSALLVTARHSLSELAGVYQLYLDTLPANEAMELLTMALGPQRVRAESAEEALRLVQACGGLPLALRLAASRLASRPSWSLAAFNDRLTDERARLDEFRQADLALRSSFAVSYEHLPAQAQCVFRCCGLFPGPDFAAAPIAALAGFGEAAVADLLETLVDASLLHSRAPGRYHLHDLVRIYAMERAAEHEADSVTAQRLSRLSDWYLASADLADQTLMPTRARFLPDVERGDLPVVPRFGDHHDALTWFESERRNLREVVQTLARRGLHPPVWQIALVIKGFLELRRYTDDWIAIFELARVSVQEGTDPYAHARVLNGLGGGYWRRERADDAVSCYLQALTIMRGIGDRRTEAILLVNLGGIYGDRREFAAAIRCLREALAIRAQVEGQMDESYALTNLGHVYHECQRFDEALPLLERALQMRREQGNRHGEGVTLHCLADTHLGLRHFDEADAAAADSLNVCTEQANRYGQAAALHTMGRIRLAQERTSEAAALLREAIAIYSEVGSVRDLGDAEADLATVLARR